MNKHLFPILFSAFLVILVALYAYSSNNRKVTIYTAQNSPVPTTTRLPSPKPTQAEPLPIIPELDTTNWKLYTEKGKRYSTMIGVDGDIIHTVTGYKKYTFKYPPAWVLTSDPKVQTEGRSTNAILTNPNTGYTIGIGYAANRDYSTEVIYTLPNGMRVEASSEFGSKNIDYVDGFNLNAQYKHAGARDEYAVIVEETEKDWHIVSVDVPITDSKAKTYALEDIAVGRAIVKTFNLVK
jgi:hypothetical protein